MVIANSIVFSIIMPTLNAENTIGMSLDSIYNQDYDMSKVEVLVIDGGSTDRTIEIAQNYGATIVENPQRIPETAKCIGFSRAKGRYIIMQDSDEVWIGNNNLKNRESFFKYNPDVFCLIIDTVEPGKNCGVACSYLNAVGDPFGYIVYNICLSRTEQNKKYLIRHSEYGNVYKFDEGQIAPIGDGQCTTIDIIKARELFGEKTESQEFATSIFIQMMNETKKMGIIPGDSIIHYSKASFKSYLSKLRFRVNINLNNVERSGYASRARKNKAVSRRKWLFVLYVMTVVGPIFDSVKLSFKYKDISFLLHFVYTYYICWVVFEELLRKIFGIKGKYRYGV